MFTREQVDRTTRERRTQGSALVVSLVLLLLLTVLGTTLLSLSGMESNISHNDLWSEGALHAAEAGIHAGLDQLQPDFSAATQPLPDTPVSIDYNYRSGARTDAGAQPLVFLGKQQEAGFSIGTGTGYNPSGYSFARFRINATGSGPRNTRREVEVLADYGPVQE